MRKAYLLLFSDATGGKQVIREWLNREGAVIHWRTDMPNSFYLISEATANELSQSLMNRIGKKGRHLVTEITDNRQGMLPKETWHLLRHKRREAPPES